MSSQQFEYEMGYTPSEFARVLEGNFTGAKSIYHANRLKPDHWRLGSLDSAIQIDLTLQQQAPRKLGQFSLPVLNARFAITHASAQETQDFFVKFFKYFHKGGG